MFLCMNCCIEVANWIVDILFQLLSLLFLSFCHSLFIVYVFIFIILYYIVINQGYSHNSNADSKGCLPVINSIGLERSNIKLKCEQSYYMNSPDMDAMHWRTKHALLVLGGRLQSAAIFMNVSLGSIAWCCVVPDHTIIILTGTYQK